MVIMTLVVITIVCFRADKLANLEQTN